MLARKQNVHILPNYLAIPHFDVGHLYMYRVIMLDSVQYDSYWTVHVVLYTFFLPFLCSGVILAIFHIMFGDISIKIEYREGEIISAAIFRK